MQNPSSAYTEVRVAYGQRVDVEIRNNTYGFKMDYYHQSFFTIYSGDSNKELYFEEEGEIFQAYGIEVILKEAKYDYLILLVKSI